MASVDVVGLIFGSWDRWSKRATCMFLLEKNLEKLQKQKEDLVAKKADVMGRVSKDEERHMLKLEEVEVWRKHVDASIAKVDELLADGPREIERLCLGACCSINCLSSLKFASKVTDSLEDMAALYNRNFVEVARQAPALVLAEIPGDQPVGLETMFDKVWRCLVDENIGIVGLWGMGGVGKTTLVKQIYQQFSKTRKDFEMIWAVVSKEFKLERVQDVIGKKLGLCYDEQWKEKDVDDKAASIFNVLLKKKFVLILDDIWQQIELEKVGVPRPNKQSESKIIFTTRSDDVCGNMGAKKIIKLDPLTPEKAWQLFKENIDEDILKIPSVLPLAKEVARECNGLPLALITISRAMARKKAHQEWKYALDILRSSVSNLPDMENKVLPLLKFSYDNLPNDAARSCFLYCSLFPEDQKIVKDDLIDYLICEELIERDDDAIDLRNKGYNDIGDLVRVCLLEEEGEYVKMHDVIRDMALWIAQNHEDAGKRIFVRTGARLTKVPSSKEWQEVKRMSLVGNMIEKIEEAPVCHNLSTLFLSFNPLVLVHDDFFQFMNALTVLDLSHSRITNLPAGISKLVLLQYLDLSYSRIKELPLELNQLVKLKCLNTEWTEHLVKIPQNLLSSLKQLQILRMLRCEYFSKIKQAERKVLLEEVLHLIYLSVLSITVFDATSFQQLPSCVHALQLLNFNDAVSLDISLLIEINKLEVLTSSLQEFNVNSMMGGQAQAPSSLCTSTIIKERSFNNLQEVSFAHCNYLLHLTWLILAPNLRTLRVVVCNKIREIISASKLHEVLDAYGNQNPLGKLEVLVLWGASNLESIYWDALPFPSLKRIQVMHCRNLKRLPLNSNSAKDCNIVIKAKEIWWNNVDWEDEATKSTFLPCFVPIVNVDMGSVWE